MCMYRQVLAYHVAAMGVCRVDVGKMMLGGESVYGVGNGVGLCLHCGKVSWA